MDIQVYSLADHPEIVHAVATNIFNIRRSVGESLDDGELARIIEGMSGQTPGKLPVTFAVTVDGEPISTMTIQEREVENYDAGPWLSNVFLNSEYHKTYRGAKALNAGFKHVASVAKQLGATRVYLYTSSEDLIPIYKKAGWDQWEKRKHRGRIVNVGILSLG